jgi:hypothetical protein
MPLPPPTRLAREAYATLLTTSDESYLAGAIALSTSIRAFDDTRKLLALVTPAVPEAWHHELRGAGFEVVPVDEIEEFWWGSGHERCRSYASDQDARWGHESTKLRLWELESYEKIRRPVQPARVCSGARAPKCVVQRGSHAHPAVPAYLR